MHRMAAKAMARSMFFGGSFGPDPRVMTEEGEEGNLDPCVMEHPGRGEEQDRPNQRGTLPPAEAAMTMDLLTNPLNSGKAEMDAAPTVVSAAVMGMLLYKPPRSDPFIFPVW